MDIVEFVEIQKDDNGLIDISASERVIAINIYNEGTVNVEHSFGSEGYNRTLYPLSGRDYSVPGENQIIAGKLYFRFSGAGTKKLIVTKSILRSEC